MKENMDCNIVTDLMELSLDGLTSEESEQLIQEHIQSCKKCRKYRELLITERQEREKNEQENDKKIPGSPCFQPPSSKLEAGFWMQG